MKRFWNLTLACIHCGWILFSSSILFSLLFLKEKNMDNKWIVFCFRKVHNLYPYQPNIFTMGWDPIWDVFRGASQPLSSQTTLSSPTKCNSESWENLLSEVGGEYTLFTLDKSSFYSARRRFSCFIFQISHDNQKCIPAFYTHATRNSSKCCVR